MTRRYATPTGRALVYAVSDVPVLRRADHRACPGARTTRASSSTARPGRTRGLERAALRSTTKTERFALAKAVMAAGDMRMGK